MNAREYLLVKLIEECQEVSQRATKALTFGLYEKQAEGPSTRRDEAALMNNNERLAQEFTDLIAVTELLNKFLRHPLSVTDFVAKEAKKVKIRKYMEYSKSLGTLEDTLPIQTTAGTGFAPPICSVHNEQMVLGFYTRPGSAPGNGWMCPTCAKART